MNYNPQTQGFSRSPGGVPHGATPSHSSIDTSVEVKRYLGVITSMLYNDLIGRGTQYATFMASCYSQNGYVNTVIEDALSTAADYCEYLMDTQHQTFNQVITEVVVTTNNLILGRHFTRSSAQIPVPVTEHEIHRYRADAVRMEQLRPLIVNHIKSKRTSTMFNQPPNSFNPNSGFGAPAGNPFMAQGSGFGNAAPAYTPPNANPLAVLNNAPPHIQQKAMQLLNSGWTPDAILSALSQAMRGQSATPPPQRGFGGFGSQTGGFGQTAFNPHAMASNHNAFTNAPVASPAVSSDDPGFFSQSAQRAVQPPLHSQSGFNNQPNSTGFNTNHNSTTNATGQLNDSVYSSGGQDYIKRLYADCARLGIPTNGVTVSYMESAIQHANPNNGYIQPNNAYSESKGRVRTPTSGDYAPVHNHDVEQHLAKATKSATSFTDYVAGLTGGADTKRAPTGETKVLVDQPDGSRIWIRKDAVDNFQRNNTDMNINQTPVNFSGEAVADTKPYPFATMSVTGDYVIEGKYHRDIPADKRGIFNVPAMFLAGVYDPYYICDKEGVLIAFFTRTLELTDEEIEMEYNLHNTERFFNPLTKHDVDHVTDNKELMEKFVNLQTEQKVTEIIKDLESQSGVLEADDALVLSGGMIHLDGQVAGDLVGDDYYTMAYSALKEEMGDVEYQTDNIAINYEHVHFYKWLVKDEDYKIALKLRHNSDYESIASILDKLATRDSFPAAWFTRLNEVATRYINRVIDLQLGLADSAKFTCDSFSLDIHDVLEEVSALGKLAEFNKTARQLTSTLLHLFDESNPHFTSYFNVDDDAENGVEYGAFGIVRDVTVLPIHSRDLPLLGESQSVLTRDGFNQLWAIARERFNNCSHRTAEIVIVTTDNRCMYLSKSENQDIYLVTKRSIFE